MFFGRYFTQKKTAISNEILNEYLVQYKINPLKSFNTEIGYIIVADLFGRLERKNK